MRWLKNSVRILAKEDGSVQFRKKGKQLFIYPIKKSDAGTYVCKNTLTKKNMGKFRVVVKGTSALIFLPNTTTFMTQDVDFLMKG